ncbi:hypothetical protein HF086_012011 [Spodoptera exigua]|uniref:Uncharacterized protein n=1 Tax=Spodoptera exigua TaxID=7107 RepID=A0A922SHR8_SPOEX|nr:hypothetical protein HF086_012011 [Spodoptera exigua]
MNAKHKIIILNDQQNDEIDIYFLDLLLSTKEYVKLHNIKQYKTVLQDLARAHQNVFIKNCCCWYARNEWIGDYLRLHCGLSCHKSLNFMSKQHRCAINNCLCCCSDKLVIADEGNEINKITTSDKPRDWYNKMTERTDLGNSTIVKYFSRSNINLSTSNITCTVKNEVSSINSKIIDMHSKNKLLRNLCCWYAQEERAAHFLKDGWSKSVINFMRRPHLCVITNCNCCCKPKKNQKLKLSHFDNPVGYTDQLNKYHHLYLTKDVVKPKLSKSRARSYKVSRLKCPDESRAKPVNTSRPKPVVASIPNPVDGNSPNPVETSRPNSGDVCRPNPGDVSRTYLVNVIGSNLVNVSKPILENERYGKFEPNSRKNNHIVSFPISLSAFEYVLHHKNEASLREIIKLVMEKKRPPRDDCTHDLEKVVHFIINTSHSPYSVVIQGIDINNLTTKELLILDMCFKAIQNFSLHDNTAEDKQTPETSGENKDLVSINEELSATASLRSYQLAMSLRHHLRDLQLPRTQS